MGDNALVTLLFPLAGIVIALIIYGIVLIVYNVRRKKCIKRTVRPELTDEDKEILRREITESDELKEKLLAIEQEAEKLKSKPVYKKVTDELQYIIDKADSLSVRENVFTGFHVGESVILVNSAIGHNDDGYYVKESVSYEDNKKSCRFGEAEDLRIDISPHLTDIQTAAMALLLMRRDDIGNRYETEFYDLLILPKKYGNFYCDVNTVKGEKITLSYGVPPFGTASITLKSEYFSRQN